MLILFRENAYFKNPEMKGFYHLVLSTYLPSRVLMHHRRSRQMPRRHTHHDYRYAFSLSPLPICCYTHIHIYSPIYYSGRPDREIEIAQALQEKVVEYEKVILSACDLCAEVDCLLSFAEASRAYGYVRPEMTEGNVIDIRQGRQVFSVLFYHFRDELRYGCVVADTRYKSSLWIPSYPMIHISSGETTLRAKTKIAKRWTRTKIERPIPSWYALARTLVERYVSHTG